MAEKVGIVGVGQVGAAAGFLLAGTPGVAEIVLVDLDRARAEGEAADIAHAAAFGHAPVVRAGGYAALAGAAVVVITAGVSLKPGQTRLDLLASNVAVVAKVIAEVVAHAPEAVLLFATNPVDVMPMVAARQFGVPPSRAIGTGCALDSARFRDRLARHLGIGPGAVHAHVLGEHGDSEVLVWSAAQVGGLPLLRFAEIIGQPIAPATMEEISRDVRRSAYRIKEGKGVSNYGIAGCIARLTKAIVNDEQVVFSISTPMESLLGVQETCVSLPHILGRRGASAPFLPPLDAAEEAALKHSAGIISEAASFALASLDHH
ncbi:L-lactate dehydrogenase [Acetobacteraceae bacterium H6797]|nr:L-lactate dehydrogenase [Acetobacteraceae bacterium H6797]